MVSRILNKSEIHTSLHYFQKKAYRQARNGNRYVFHMMKIKTQNLLLLLQTHVETKAIHCLILLVDIKIQT